MSSFTKGVDALVLVTFITMICFLHMNKIKFVFTKITFDQYIECLYCVLNLGTRFFDSHPVPPIYL